jgi:hypothetical protein
MCQDRKANETQKKRALDLAHSMAESKVAGKFIRGAALDAVIKCDPTGGKPFVNKYADDEDAHVRARARGLIAPAR